MQEGIQRGKLNPDKGMDTRKYLMTILIFLIVACIGMYVWARSSTAIKTNLHTTGLAGDGKTAFDKGGNR